MNEEAQQYVLWLRGAPSSRTVEEMTHELHGYDGVRGVQIAESQNSAISRKETVLTIVLSVTANFATDGIKKVVEMLNEKPDAEVVYCRRPNGEELVLDKTSQAK